MLRRFVHYLAHLIGSVQVYRVKLTGSDGRAWVESKCRECGERVSIRLMEDWPGSYDRLEILCDALMMAADAWTKTRKDSEDDD